MGRGSQGLVSGLGFSLIHTYVAARVLHAWYMAGVFCLFCFAAYSWVGAIGS